MDADRVARDGRVETAAAEFFTAQEELTRTIERAERSMGRAVGKLLSEGESVARVAALVGVAEADVRRLAKLAQPKRTARAPSTDDTADDPASADAAPGSDAA